MKKEGHLREDEANKWEQMSSIYDLVSITNQRSLTISVLSC